ncbi:putative beta-lysine N-acetyltransferase [Desulfococcaceae bacterium HSG9]|nr:putative beta-lysine N-acetyltransferase [Desulfococcaceae bacterium HSG9]
MVDKIEKLKRSTIQHGPHNSRIYLMKLHSSDLPDIIPALDDLAAGRNYGKILSKVPEDFASFFLDAGYIQEAIIPEFFNNGQGALFLSKFIAPERFKEQNALRDADQMHRIEALISQPLTKIGVSDNRPILSHQVQKCVPHDAVEMSRLFRQVFKTYPFPIFEPSYLIHSMDVHSLYFCIRHEDRIVAIAAAETDPDNHSVEMTDFAVLPAWRGHSCGLALLIKMEETMRQLHKRIAFTIARTHSLGINKMFKKQGYTYAGLLRNNTNISGGIESMTVWFRKLKKIESFNRTFR